MLAVLTHDRPKATVSAAVSLIKAARRKGFEANLDPSKSAPLDSDKYMHKYLLVDRSMFDSSRCFSRERRLRQRQ